MGKINVLDEHIANQIAAGEVVERPASVVKELVENSVDAGSRSIDVRIEEGGLTLIRVKDDGAGMDEEDVEKAFYRHATSKISSGRDLFSIRSLGFRGEALPSIAAVSRMECLTSDNREGRGCKLSIEGGKLGEKKPAAAERGTDISVRDLFYNTPARLKYMKTIQTEFGHVSDYLYRMALAHPDIAFAVRHNGNLLFQTLGNGDLLQVIAAIYGTTAAKSMIKAEGESLDYRLQGYLSKPDITRSNRTGISTVINGRYIRNYGLAQAILQAYHTLLPINRFPLAVLQLEMDPALVDVNVHPSKLEVRFSKEKELSQFVTAQLRSVLGGQVLIPKQSGNQNKKEIIQERLAFDAPSSPNGGSNFAAGTKSGEDSKTGSEAGGASGMHEKEAASAGPGSTSSEYMPKPELRRPDGPSSMRVNEAPPAGRDSSRTNDAASAENPGWKYGTRQEGEHAGADIHPQSYAASGNPSQPVDGIGSSGNPPPLSGRNSTDGNPFRLTGRNSSFGNSAGQAARNSAAGKQAGWDALYEDGGTGARPSFPELYAVGQALGTYIIAQNEEGLFLIDQHAAHERIHFEYFYEKFGRPDPVSQELLIPISMEFTPSDAEILKERLVFMEQAGIVMEPFGGSAFIVRSYPHWLPKGEEQAIIEEIAEWVIQERKAADLGALRESAAAMCACKASIKANDAMTMLEIEALMERLRGCRNPYTCPHGRPIVISFSNYELEKMFKRVM